MSSIHIIKGLVREHLMSADSPNACAHDDNLWIFDRLIDVSVCRSGSQGEDSKKRVALEKAAKAVCADCPVRLQCLTVHGPDLALGVVGGATDAERSKLFPVAVA